MSLSPKFSFTEQNTGLQNIFLQSWENHKRMAFQSFQYRRLAWGFLKWGHPQNHSFQIVSMCFQKPQNTNSVLEPSKTISQNHQLKKNFHHLCPQAPRTGDRPVCFFRLRALKGLQVCSMFTWPNGHQVGLEYELIVHFSICA